MTVYNINIIDLVRELKRIYLAGCDKVNLTVEDERTVRLNGVEPERQKALPPPKEDDIIDYL